MISLRFVAGLTALLSLALFSCKNDPKTAAADTETLPKPDTIRITPVSTEGARTYTVTEGVVYWQGKKAVGDTHNGAIQVSGGELLVNQGQLLSGRITIDMKSISVSDIQDPRERGDLESHLRDTEFFDVKNYPSAEFSFDEALPSKTPNFNAVITGQLTMKGKSNAVNIPVRLDIKGDELTAESPAFLINRTQWGVNFRSGVLGTAKDKLIEDVVPLSLKIRAKAE
ncbi:MAG: YceI family protein [Saprospiraceae bacterium]|nr:YceI family protein [Saprospiraceae bacterium]